MRTGTLAAVLVVPHDLTALAVRTCVGEGELAGPGAAEPQPATAIAAATRPASAQHALERSGPAAIGRLLSAHLIMPSGTGPPLADSPVRRWPTPVRCLGVPGSFIASPPWPPKKVRPSSWLPAHLAARHPAIPAGRVFA